MNLPFNRFGDQLFCLKSISKILTFFQGFIIEYDIENYSNNSGKGFERIGSIKNALCTFMFFYLVSFLCIPINRSQRLTCLTSTLFI